MKILFIVQKVRGGQNMLHFMNTCILFTDRAWRPSNRQKTCICALVALHDGLHVQRENFTLLVASCYKIGCLGGLANVLTPRLAQCKILVWHCETNATNKRMNRLH